MKLSREFGIPWVADFRDPWVANPFVEVALKSLRARDAADEARVLGRADAVSCVLESMRQDFLSRYPRRRADEVVTILNGFDPEHFVGIAARNGRPIGPDSPSLTMVHAGQVYGPRRIEPLLSALKEWFREEPEMAALVKVHLVGGSADHAAHLRNQSRDAGTDTWIEVESEIPHRDALRRLADATVLLFIGFAGPGEKFQMSGKIFEYLAVRRPIMALASPGSPVGDVVRASGVRHWMVSPDDSAAVVKALRAMGHAWRAGQLAGPQSTASLAAYDRREQARALAELLDRVVAVKSAKSTTP